MAELHYSTIVYAHPIQRKGKENLFIFNARTQITLKKESATISLDVQIL